LLLLSLLLDDEELVWPGEEETSPTIVSEKVPPHPIAGNEGNQGERDVVGFPAEVEGKAEDVGGNADGGNVVVCGWVIICGSIRAWATGEPMPIINEMHTSKEKNVILEKIALAPKILSMTILLSFFSNK